MKYKDLRRLLFNEIPNYDDKNFFRLLPAYDNAEKLWEWYCCFEENPLPLPVPDEDDEAA